jgi:hypothetical protein
MNALWWIRSSRQWHRWGAWSIGIFVLMWTCTGVVMITPSVQPSGAGGEPRLAGVDGAVIAPAAALAAAELPAGSAPRAMSLRMIGDRLAWQVQPPSGHQRLIDAHTAQRIQVDSATAPILARESLGSAPPVTSVVHLTESDGRYRGQLPAWRVSFADRRRTRAYVTPWGVVSFTDLLTPLKQVSGQMHTFTIPGLQWPRGTARRLTLTVAGAVTVALGLTGFVLLLPLRRRDRA